MCKYQAGVDAQQVMDISSGREVLPTNVKPTHYDLTLEPHFETFKYDGKVIIE
jgi:aminopeptidase 2